MKLKNFLIPLAILGTVVVVYFLTRKRAIPTEQNSPNPSGSGAYAGQPLTTSPVQQYNVAPLRFAPDPALYSLPLGDPNSSQAPGSAVTNVAPSKPLPNYLTINIPPGQDTTKIPAKIDTSASGACGCKSPCDSDFGKQLVSSRGKQVKDLAKNEPGIFDVLFANLKSAGAFENPAFMMYGIMAFDQQQNNPQGFDATVPAAAVVSRAN
jgi:hypothetical protein